MNRKQTLDDTWMYWNAERLDEYARVSDNEHAPATTADDHEGGDQRSPGIAMVEVLLLYVGGVSAALVGMGLVVLIGSFLSAYSALNAPVAGEQAMVPGQPYLSLQRPAPSAKAGRPEAIVVEPAGSGAVTGGELSPTGDTRSPRKLSSI